jgi:uncharacterized protein (TIGR03437 family)
MKQFVCTLFLGLVIPAHLALSQSSDFLNPQQNGPFRIDGLSYAELAVTGPQSGFVDPVNLGSDYSVPTLDETIAEIAATGANLVKITLNIGEVQNYTDNAYDPSVPFPLEGTSGAILAFGHKLTAQGIPCLLQPLASVEHILIGSGSKGSDRPQPADPRAFMAQHIPRLVSLAQLAEGMGCEYFSIFGDDIEQLVVDPTVTDLWVQAIAQVRQVFSGRLTSMSSWGENGGGYTFDHQPQIIGMLDVFGIGFFPAYTNLAEPTVAELVASWQMNADGHDSFQSVADMHAVYAKPILVTDEAYGSFFGANLGEQQLYQDPASAFTVDDQAQVNLYQAFFQAMPTLDPNWMLGAVFDSFDRYPYQWANMFLPLYLGSEGEPLRGKPALQTLTQAYRTSQPVTVPANGWWYDPAAPDVFYALEAENGVVNLASLAYSDRGSPQWNLARCAQIAPGSYVGTQEQYTGGQALNQPPTQPAAIRDGPAVQLVFGSAATATLQIGTQNISIQRYQFSAQWASPMLNAPRTGWWDRPAQSGRGYFLEVQGNTLLMGGLIYDSSGQPIWFMSTGPVDSTGKFLGNLTACSAAAGAPAPACTQTANAIGLAFSSPWDASLTLAQEAPVEIRRYRLTEIGWAGPAPSFSLPSPAFIGQSAVVNAASASTGVTPGSIAAILGTGLTRGVSGVARPSTSGLPYSIEGTSVLVNGIPAPLFAIANINGQEQVVFQAPWEAQGQPIPEVPISPIITTTLPAVSIVVVNNGSVSPAMRALFYDIQPAIFTSDGAQAVAVHSDYSLVTSRNPAQEGEVITFYGTGFGPVTPLPATGAPAGSSPPSIMSTAPTVSINSHNATVLFAGLSPGSVALYQFNVVVPDRVGIGNLNVLIDVGGTNSNLVTIPVQ